MHFIILCILSYYKRYTCLFDTGPPCGLSERSAYSWTTPHYFDMDAMTDSHEYIFIDEAGFNLTKWCKRGGNIIGQCAITQVPGQRGGNITMCAAISNRGVLHCHAILGPYNTALLLQFLDQLHNNILQQEGEPGQPEQAQYVVIWDNMSFHRAALVCIWFNDHPRFRFLFPPAYSPFLNAIEDFFSRFTWEMDNNANINDWLDQHN